MINMSKIELMGHINMKYIIVLLFAMISHSFGFNYDRMLERRGYTNQGGGYYSKFDQRFNQYNMNAFYYSECLVMGDTLGCRQMKVDCHKYTVEVSSFQLYLNGVEQSIDKIIHISHKIDSDEYRIWGHYYVVGMFGIVWRPTAIEVDSYEDQQCIENTP